MSLTELKKRSDRLEYINKRMKCQFPSFVFKDCKNCFVLKNGSFFRVEEFPGSNALVIEYAENEEDAKTGRFEDGDRFFLDELNEPDMFDAMLKEIES